MFDEAFEKLKNMRDCKALLFSDNRGDPITYFENSVGVGIKEMSKDINGVLQALHQKSDEYSLGDVHSVQINTQESIVFSLCSGDKERIHIHLFILFEPKTNVALATMAMDEAMKKVMQITDTMD